MRHWVIDACNVLGARPDGWWRDRPAALSRLLDEITRWRAERGEPAIVVIDGRPDPLGPAPGRWHGVETRYAGRSDRDAADDTIVELLAPGAELAGRDVTVVTSDRDLAGRATALGATIEGARAYRDRVDDIAPRRADRAVLAEVGIDETAFLGRGGEARVFALDDDRVLRLPHPGTSDDALARRRAFLDGLTGAAVPFAVPEVLDHRVLAGRTVVIERRLPGRSGLVALARSRDRTALLRAHLDAAATIAALPGPAAFGEIVADAVGPTESFAGWARTRIGRSLAAAGAPFDRLDPDALTDELLAALPDPEPALPRLVHLDAYLGNMLADGERITAVLDFGPTTIGGPPDLDPLAAIAYLTPEITPGVTPDDRVVAERWAVERELGGALEVSRRWLAALWAWADDDERLHAWCRRILLG